MGCYTCEPQKRIRDLIIEELPSGRFNFDLKGRPLIVFTARQHVKSLHELPADELKKCFSDIDDFMRRVQLPDYQILANFGSWVNHGHAHIKIKANEASILSLRSDHLLRRGLLRSRPYRIGSRNEDRGESVPGGVREAPEQDAAAAAAGENGAEKAPAAMIVVKHLGAIKDTVHS